MHTSISYIFHYDLSSLTTLRHSKPLPLEIHVGIVTFTPDLQSSSFYSAAELFYYSSITRFILILLYINSFNSWGVFNIFVGNRS